MTDYQNIGGVVRNYNYLNEFRKGKKGEEEEEENTENEENEKYKQVKEEEEEEEENDFDFNFLPEDTLKLIQKDESFVCDYITFQFQTVSDRFSFMKILVDLIGPMKTRDISYDGIDRYAPAVKDKDKDSTVPDQIEGLLNYDTFKSNIYYLSFAGDHGNRVYPFLFETTILQFLNRKEKSVELKRLDFKAYLEIQILAEKAKVEYQAKDDKSYVLHNISRMLKSDPFVCPYISLGVNLCEQTSHASLTSSDIVDWTCSSTGWTNLLGVNNKLKKIRIYYKKTPEKVLQAAVEKGKPINNRISMEVQYNKTIANKFTVHWKKNNFQAFIKFSLEEYTKTMKELPPSFLNTLYIEFILPRLQGYLRLFEVQKFNNNSVITGINCIRHENQKNEKFYLENTSEFVSFLAIYISVINHATQELWKLETFKKIPYMNEKNMKVFKFDMSSLLFLVGWKDTPYLRLKMKKSLMNLHKYKISSAPNILDKEDKRSGFHCLITNLTMTAYDIEISINMRVLVTLIEPISNIDLSLFSSILPAYNAKFKSDNKTKMTYPFYFYPLVAQILSSVNNDIRYLGNPPTSGTAKLEFTHITKWIFSQIPQYMNYNSYDAEKNQKEDFVRIKTIGGSFTYPNFNKKIHNR